MRLKHDWDVIRSPQKMRTRTIRALVEHYSITGTQADLKQSSLEINASLVGPDNESCLIITQVQACMVETEKIGSLLATSSPTMTAFVQLSIFITAETRTSYDATPAAYSLTSSATSLTSSSRRTGFASSPTSFYAVLWPYIYAMLTSLHSVNFYGAVVFRHLSPAHR